MCARRAESSGWQNRYSRLPCTFATRSVARGLSIFARFRGAVINMVRGVNHDRLIPAKRTGCSASNFVPELQQVPFRFRRESEFQRDLPTIGHLFTGWFGRADMLNARSIARLLQAHPEIDKVQNDLHVALR